MYTQSTCKARGHILCSGNPPCKGFAPGSNLLHLDHWPFACETLSESLPLYLSPSQLYCKWLGTGAIGLSFPCSIVVFILLLPFQHLHHAAQLSSRDLSYTWRTNPNKLTQAPLLCNIWKFLDAHIQGHLRIFWHWSRPQGLTYTSHSITRANQFWIPSISLLRNQTWAHISRSSCDHGLCHQVPLTDASSITKRIAVFRTNLDKHTYVTYCYIH